MYVQEEEPKNKDNRKSQYNKSEYNFKRILIHKLFLYAKYSNKEEDFLTKILKEHHNFNFFTVHVLWIRATSPIAGTTANDKYIELFSGVNNQLFLFKKSLYIYIYICILIYIYILK